MRTSQKIFLRSLALTLAILFTSLVALAQGGGSLRGQVVDEFGGLIVGATVTITDAQGVEKATATTNNEGNFTINGLAPGKYTVTAIAQGFARYENVEVEVAQGRPTKLDIRLSVTIEESRVTVAQEAAVDTTPENNASALVLSGNDLDALPDDPDELAAALQALAGPSAGPNGGQFYIDGFTGGRLPPKNSIREIRINQNPFSAEYDRLGFGRVEIFTKPGTDRFRGQMFLNFNDESLNSRNPYAPRRAPHQQRTFGGNLSGPVISKKASFFMDFERREIDDNAVINAVVLDQNLNPQSFRDVLVVPQRRITASPRLDYQPNANNTLVGRYSFTRTTSRNSNVGGFSLRSRAIKTESTEQSVQLTETMVVTPHVLNETRFQFYRNAPRSQGDNSQPTIVVRDAFTGGGSGVGLAFDTENRWELQNYTSWVIGHHSFKAGARVRGVHITDFTQANFNGTFTFTSLDQYRNTLLGLDHPSQFSIASGNPESSVSQIDFGPFIQDDWRARPNLTLSAGLRYENQSNIHSNLNFAPRVAFAWSPGAGGSRQPKTVIRGGFGVFYDRFNESFTLSAIRFNGTNQQQFIVPYVVLPNGQPAFTFPNVPSIATLEAFKIPQTLRRVAPDLQSPYTMQSAISVERLLPYKITLSVTYINARTLHLLRSRDINAPLPGTFDPLHPALIRRPDPTQGDIFEYESTGRLNQNQLIVQINNRFNQKLTLFGNYTLNRVRSDSDGAFTFPMNSYDLSNEYGRAAFDIRHRVFFGGSIGAPWGLRLNPLIVFFSGRPFNITTGVDANGDLQYNERPAFATDLSRPSVVVTRFGAFDLNPLPGATIIPRNFGNGPVYFAVNMQVSKTWSFGTMGGNRAASTQGSGGNQQGGQQARQGGGQQQQGNSNFVLLGGGQGGNRAGGGGQGGSGAGAGSQGGGPVRMGGLLGGGNNSAGNRYSFTFSIPARNLFNRTNQGQFIGNLRSPLFGQSNSLNGAFGGFGPGGLI